MLQFFGMSANSSPIIKTDSQLDAVSYYKLNIEDLKACMECEEGRNKWTLDIGNEKILDVKFVWLQGEILEVNEDSFVLDDATGTCKVMANNAVQSSNTWLSPGKNYQLYSTDSAGTKLPDIIPHIVVLYF